MWCTPYGCREEQSTVAPERQLVAWLIASIAADRRHRGAMFPHRSARSSRNRMTPGILDFGRPPPPSSGSPPLPLLITECQNPAFVLVPSPDLEFRCVRNASRGIRYAELRCSASKMVSTRQVQRGTPALPPEWSLRTNAQFACFAFAGPQAPSHPPRTSRYQEQCATCLQPLLR